MSFCNDVRNELARVIPAKECCRKAELLALLDSAATVVDAGEQGYLLKLRAENAATARKIFKLIKENYSLSSGVSIEPRRHFSKTKIYEVNTPIPLHNLSILQEIKLITANNTKLQVNKYFTRVACCKRAYLRGIFLSRGFINQPAGEYHLEIVFDDHKLAAQVQKMVGRFSIHMHSFERKSKLVLYLKESEKIVDFLRVVGANRALLDFENVRILKSMRNAVNRQVNCETANLAKTIDASVRQIDLISRAMQKEDWQRLPPQYKELALLRVDYPDCSLKELGELTDPQLSKPGVAYRMRKLEKIAEEIIADN